MLTEQEKFDIVARGLLLQGRRSVNPSEPSMCLLIAPNGDRCAFGMLLPTSAQFAEEPYHHVSMTSQEIQTHFDRLGVSWSLDSGFVESHLFQVHNFSDPKDWVSELKRIAKERNLSDAIVDQTIAELADQAVANAAELLLETGIMIDREALVVV